MGCGLQKSWVLRVQRRAWNMSLRNLTSAFRNPHRLHNNNNPLSGPNKTTTHKIKTTTSKQSLYIDRPRLFRCLFLVLCWVSHPPTLPREARKNPSPLTNPKTHTHYPLLSTLSKMCLSSIIFPTPPNKGARKERAAPYPSAFPSIFSHTPPRLLRSFFLFYLHTKLSSSSSSLKVTRRRRWRVCR